MTATRPWRAVGARSLAACALAMASTAWPTEPGSFETARPQAIASANQSGFCRPTILNADVQLFCSPEVGQSAALARAAVDRLDDEWRSRVDPASIVVGRVLADELPIVLRTTHGAVVSAELVDITDAQLQNEEHLGTPARTPGFADSVPPDALQDGAPKPACPELADDPFWNERSGSTVSRNAVRFRFNPPTTAFGAWFGDLETRNDGFGTPAIVRIVGLGDTPVGDAVVVTSTADQNVCGGNDAEGCGSLTTRWIGFVSKAPIAAMLVVVGDHDREGHSDGHHEHISFIGPTLAWIPSPTPNEPAGIHAVFLPALYAAAYATLQPGPRLPGGACEG